MRPRVAHHLIQIQVFVLCIRFIIAHMYGLAVQAYFYGHVIECLTQNLALGLEVVCFFVRIPSYTNLANQFYSVTFQVSFLDFYG